MSRNSGKKKQDDVAIGKIASLLKPVVDRYNDIKEDRKRFLVRDTLMKFTRCYSFVTSLIRFDDKELFKDYLFVSHLTHVLPKSPDAGVDISDKIQLEYTKLKETFHGAIKLEEGAGAIESAKLAKPNAEEKKVDTLDRIIQKVNEAFEGDFGPSNKAVLDSVYKMLIDDEVVKKKLKKFAENNDAAMFIQSIFPGEFNRVLAKCVNETGDAFERLLTNSEFQKAIMNIMARELYKSLSKKDR